MDLEEYRRRAEKALSKPARYGPDLDVRRFSSTEEAQVLSRNFKAEFSHACKPRN